MKSFNWFNDLSSILTLDLATAAVEETEPESMEFLANELGDKVEKLSQISWKEMFERYVPVVCDYLLRIALVLVIFFGGRKLIKKIVSLCDQALKRHGMEVTVRRFFCNVINALGYICMLAREAISWRFAKRNLIDPSIMADGRTDGNIADCTCSICWCCSWSCASGKPF